MGQVIYFPFEKTHASKYASLPKEPAQVIQLPVIEIADMKRIRNISSSAPPGEEQCRR